MNERFYLLYANNPTDLKDKLNAHVDITETVIFFGLHGTLWMAVIDRAGVIIDENIQYTHNNDVVSSA